MGSGRARVGLGGKRRCSRTAPASSSFSEALALGDAGGPLKRLTPAQGHSSTPCRWQKEILSGFFFFVVFLSFLVFCLFLGFLFFKRKIQ